MILQNKTLSLLHKYFKGNANLRNQFSTSTEVNNSCNSLEHFYEFSFDFPTEIKAEFLNYFKIHPEFISSSEEESLLTEILPIMKRKRYEFDHWDNAIHGYRETQRLQWSPPNFFIIQKFKNLSFSKLETLPHVHVLDLHDKGYIKPHIDSTRYCGSLISGLNLLSDAVIRLKHTSGYYCDVLAERLSVYSMSGMARYDFTHEVLPLEKSIFKGIPVSKRRRISVILRSKPQNDEE